MNAQAETFDSPNSLYKIGSIGLLSLLPIPPRPLLRLFTIMFQTHSSPSLVTVTDQSDMNNGLHVMSSTSVINLICTLNCLKSLI